MPSLAQQQREHIDQHLTDMYDIVDLLQECYAECQTALTMHAPREAGSNLSYLHLKRLQACSDICATTARLLLKDGIGVDRLCEIAARLCEQCAFACDAVGSMRHCAEICRETASACLEASYGIKTRRQAA